MLFNRTTLLLLFTLLIILCVFSPWICDRSAFFSSLGNSRVSLEAKRREYTLPEAVAYVAKNGSTVIVCAVSQPYLPYLNNWLISIVRQQYHEKVLVIAEDFATLYTINGRWPGHVVLIPHAPDAQVTHKFGFQMRQWRDKWVEPTKTAMQPLATAVGQPHINTLSKVGQFGQPVSPCHRSIPSPFTPLYNQPHSPPLTSIVKHSPQSTIHESVQTHCYNFQIRISTAMESMKMKLFAAVVVMLMAVSAVSNVAAQEAPAPAPGPASAASVYVPAALISLLSLSFGFLF
ncbi:hypothetical protein L1887_19093 [Cichorium endivia]|nr:hypothetical protein L1887_19093 [Cichorium endivia]